MEEVRFELETDITVKIITDDDEYLKGMITEFTEYIPGFRFMTPYKMGRWNGKVSMINAFGRFPYGLLMDIIRTSKKIFPRNKLVVDDKLKALFKGKYLKPKWDLNLKPRPYQKDCIIAALERTKGVVLSSTASGKSLTITYIIKTILENTKLTGVNKALIVVPTISLVEQFHGDMIEYGIDSKLIGKVHGKSKQWDNTIVVSTWQTLMKNHDKLNAFGCVIIDESHQGKSHELRKILAKCKGSPYRLGFTGTMHSGKLDNWNTKAYIGPIIREYPSGLLAEQGYVSKCTVNMMKIMYVNSDIEGTYNEVKEEMFNNEYRMNLIVDLVKKLDHNVLMLVGKVEKEGEVLETILKERTKKDIMFLSGRNSVEEREEWRHKLSEKDNIGLIATYQIFSTGINVPNLKYIILASPFKSKIRVIQSIGRSLRKHSNKEHGAQIFDIHDITTFFEDHGYKRLRFYDAEKFEVKETTFSEYTGMVDLSLLE